MTGGLGQKINRRVKSLGMKIDKQAHRLGNKANDVLGKVQGQNSTLIRKGSNSLHALRAGIDATDSIVRKAVEVGAGNIPIIGGGLQLTSQGIHGARQLIDRGDKSLKKYKNMSDKVMSTAKSHANELEKFNIRKQIENAVSDDTDGGFA